MHPRRLPVPSSPSYPRPGAVLRGIALSLFALQSCTAVLNDDPAQCSVHADCLAKGPAFAEMKCFDGVCGLPALAPGQCRSSADCAAGAMCNRSSRICASLESSDCSLVLSGASDLARDDTVVLGALLPLTGPDPSSGIAMRKSLELAWQEFADSGGLPSATPGAPSRPVVLVACDESANAARAAHHLVADLGVPALIGPAGYGQTARIVPAVNVNYGTLFLTPGDTSSTLPALADNGLVWRTAPSDTQQARTLALMVARLEPEIRTTLGISATQGVKFAVAFEGSTQGNAMAADLAALVTVNSKTSANNGDDFLTVTYGDPHDPGNIKPQDGYDVAVAAVLRQRPHVLVLAGGAEGINNVLAAVEHNWTPLVTYRPILLLTSNARVSALMDWVGNDEALRKRLRGVLPGRDNPIRQAFESRYRAATGDSAGGKLLGSASAYDAFYTLAYGIAATRDAPLTGATLASSLSLLTGKGDPKAVGPDGMAGMFATLATGEVNLAGASGPLGFNLTTGDAPTDIDVWCVSAIPTARRRASRAAASTLTLPPGCWLEPFRARNLG